MSFEQYEQNNHEPSRSVSSVEIQSNNYSRVVLYPQHRYIISILDHVFNSSLDEDEKKMEYLISLNGTLLSQLDQFLFSKTNLKNQEIEENDENNNSHSTTIQKKKDEKLSSIFFTYIQSSSSCNELPSSTSNHYYKGGSIKDGFLLLFINPVHLFQFTFSSKYHHHQPPLFVNFYIPEDDSRQTKQESISDSLSRERHFNNNNIHYDVLDFSPSKAVSTLDILRNVYANILFLNKTELLDIKNSVEQHQWNGDLERYLQECFSLSDKGCSGGSFSYLYDHMRVSSIHFHNIGYDDNNNTNLEIILNDVCSFLSQIQKEVQLEQDMHFEAFPFTRNSEQSLLMLPLEIQHWEHRLCQLQTLESRLSSFQQQQIIPKESFSHDVKSHKSHNIFSVSSIQIHGKFNSLKEKLNILLRKVRFICECINSIQSMVRSCFPNNDSSYHYVDASTTTHNNNNNKIDSTQVLIGKLIQFQQKQNHKQQHNILKSISNNSFKTTKSLLDPTLMIDVIIPYTITTIRDQVILPFLSVEKFSYYSSHSNMSRLFIMFGNHVLNYCHDLVMKTTSDNDINNKKGEQNLNAIWQQRFVNSTNGTDKSSSSALHICIQIIQSTITCYKTILSDVLLHQLSSSSRNFNYDCPTIPQIFHSIQKFSNRCKYIINISKMKLELNEMKLKVKQVLRDRYQCAFISKSDTNVAVSHQRMDSNIVHQLFSIQNTLSLMIHEITIFQSSSNHPNPLSLEDESFLFEEDYHQLIERVNNKYHIQKLKKQISDLISTLTFNCRSNTQTSKILEAQYFYDLFHHAGGGITNITSARIIDDNDTSHAETTLLSLHPDFLKIYNKFRQEILVVESIYERYYCKENHRHNHNHPHSHESIQRNIPPIAASVLWARYLHFRIDQFAYTKNNESAKKSMMNWFLDKVDSILSQTTKTTTKSKRTKSRDEIIFGINDLNYKYKRLKWSLREYELRVISHWEQNILSKIVWDILPNSSLWIWDSEGLLRTNLDPMFWSSMETARVLIHHEQTQKLKSVFPGASASNNNNSSSSFKIPESATVLYSYKTHLKRIHSNISNFVCDFNTFQNSVIQKKETLLNNNSSLNPIHEISQTLLYSLKQDIDYATHTHKYINWMPPTTTSHSSFNGKKGNTKLDIYLKYLTENLKHIQLIIHRIQHVVSSIQQSIQSRIIKKMRNPYEIQILHMDDVDYSIKSQIIEVCEYVDKTKTLILKEIESKFTLSFLLKDLFEEEKKETTTKTKIQLSLELEPILQAEFTQKLKTQMILFLYKSILYKVKYTFRHIMTSLSLRKQSSIASVPSSILINLPKIELEANFILIKKQLFQDLWVYPTFDQIESSYILILESFYKSIILSLGDTNLLKHLIAQEFPPSFFLSSCFKVRTSIQRVKANMLEYLLLLPDHDKSNDIRGSDQGRYIQFGNFMLLVDDDEFDNNSEE